MSNMNDDFVVKNLDYIIDVLDTTVGNHEVIEECINTMNNVLEHAAKPMCCHKAGKMV